MAWPDDAITLPDWVTGYVDAATMQAKTTARFNQLVARLGAVGPVFTGIVPTDASGGTTGGALNTIGSQYMVKQGPSVAIYCQVTLHAAISVPADGDVANTPLAVVPGPYVPVSFTQPLSSGGTGPMCQYVITTAGQVQLVACDSGSVLGVGKTITFCGVLLAL